MIPIETEVARLQNTLTHDLLRFIPELLVILAILLVLVTKLLSSIARVHAARIAIPLLIAALGITLSDWMTTEIFRGMLQFDGFANFFRALLLLAATLVLMLARLTRISDIDDSADFVALVLGGTLGMMLMASANNLLMIFLAVEMASLPSYALAGYLKGQSRSSEAALKYVIYGSAASGILLYGISLMVGRYGLLPLNELSVRLALDLTANSIDLPLAVALLMILFGLGFKLSIVPFHVWLPDVFEGASAEVAAILAVASKSAAMALFVRLTFTFLAIQPHSRLVESIGLLLGVLAILTATLGNIAAILQTNLQRLLAYSTIAHAGYMLMAVACLKTDAVSAVLYYLVGYLPMTIGAFAVVAMLRNPVHGTSIESVRGLLKRSPGLAIPMIVFLFSLLGLPPLAGFAGKFQIFAALYRTGAEYSLSGHDGLGTFYWTVLGAGVVNTVIGAAYYLFLIKTIAFDDPSVDDQTTDTIDIHLMARVYVTVLALATLVIGIAWDPILNLIRFTTLAQQR